MKTAVMADAASALSVRSLVVRDKLDNVSLVVKPLELHGVVGPIGSGKTTLFRALAGLVPAVGDVLLGSVPLDPDERRQHLFFLPEAAAEGGASEPSPEQLPFADERLADVLALAAVSLQVPASAVDEVVARLELEGLVHRRLRALRRGEQKRALLGVALLVPHGFLLLDEPFVGLELKEARALSNVLRTSTHERRAIVCALHGFSEAERLCDRFTLLSRGRVVGAGATHELRERARAQPGAPLEEVFLGLS
jgi:ABC-type multidrug transport system ATPase subunit